MVADHWPETTIVPNSLHLIATTADHEFFLIEMTYVKSPTFEQGISKENYPLDTFAEMLW